MNDKPLHVTRSFLPPLEDFVKRLETIWESALLTNNGPLVQELERRLCQYLRVKHCVLTSNGDAGLRVALRALDLSGEIVTTPFSYVSTVSSVLWLGLQPVFADIDPSTLTIDPEQVERAITPRTTAILATHVYGNPCDVDALQELADRKGLRLIYDAAHAFGIEINGRPVTQFGDLSMISLHATKLLHTGEGGLLATNDSQLHQQIEWRRRFGHDGPEAFHGIGINAKMSELHAAMGLCVLDAIESIIARRKKVTESYRTHLQDAGEQLTWPSRHPQANDNYSYLPVLFRNETELLSAIERLQSENIFPRRYFFPSLNKAFPELAKGPAMPVSESVAARVLCLPLSAEMGEDDVARVCNSLAQPWRGPVR